MRRLLPALSVLAWPAIVLASALSVGCEESELVGESIRSECAARGGVAVRFDCSVASTCDGVYKSYKCSSRCEVRSSVCFRCEGARVGEWR